MAVTLDAYIAEARAKNKPNDVIKATLINAGWPEDEIMKTLQAMNCRINGTCLPFFNYKVLDSFTTAQVYEIRQRQSTIRKSSYSGLFTEANH